MHIPHNDLSLVVNLHNKTEYIIYIRNLKQGLVFQKVHRAITFNQKAWLKPYIDTNTAFRKKAKYDFEKIFLKLINNAIFGKTMETVTKHRDIKPVTTEARRNYLVSEPNYTTNFF